MPPDQSGKPRQGDRYFGSLNFEEDFKDFARRFFSEHQDVQDWHRDLAERLLNNNFSFKDYGQNPSKHQGRPFRERFDDPSDLDPDDPDTYDKLEARANLADLVRSFGHERTLWVVQEVMEDMLDFPSVIQVVRAEMQARAARGEMRFKEYTVTGRLRDYERDPFTGREFSGWDLTVPKRTEGGRTDRPHDHLRKDNRKTRPR